MTTEGSTEAITDSVQQTTEPAQVITEEMKANAKIALDAGFKVTQTGSKLNINWGKVAEADGYEVYLEYCDNEFYSSYKTIADNKTTSLKVSKLDNYKLDLKDNFKAYVSAYKIVDGKKIGFAESIVGHVVGRKNAKYTNAKSIKLSKTKYTLNVGSTAKIKAKTVLVDKKKKKLSNAHEKEFRYASSDTSIATVDKNGKIKGIKAGTCNIYVYARNGLAKKVSVSVK